MFTDELGVCPEKEFAEELDKQVEKYESLVWYGRTGCLFNKYSPEQKASALSTMKKIELDYPEEIKRYGSKKGGSDFHFGFFSGCLAGFRFIRTALNQDTHIDEDDGEEYPSGGLYWARELFPQTDT